MWVLGSRRGSTYCPVYYQTLGSYFNVMLVLLCYASRRGLGECIHDRCEIVKLMVYLRWQLKHTSGWIEAPGEPSVVCFYFWKSWGTRVIFLWTATQAQRDHEIIHARNFCVQPQAIMGSGIVD